MTRTFPATGFNLTGEFLRPTEKTYLRGAFTLIELLGHRVIRHSGGLALPALPAPKGRHIAYSAWAMKNVDPGLDDYSGDNGERLVQTAAIGDHFHERPSVGPRRQPRLPDILTNRPVSGRRDFALFAPIIPADRIYQCPADRSTWPLWTSCLTFVQEERSYSMNSYVGTSSVNQLTPISINSAYKVYLKTSSSRRFTVSTVSFSRM